MVLEILRYVTSDFLVFIGATFFSVAVILAVGWSLNAMLIGFRGVKADKVVTVNSDKDS